VDLEQRVRPGHPLRMIRGIVNAALAEMSAEFDMLYPSTGRDSIPPERLLRALLLQAFYAVSQRIRKRIEEAFGWAKTVAGLRKARHRGLPKVDWQFTLAMAAYNLIRLPKLVGATLS
jgi:hypothetical protein